MKTKSKNRLSNNAKSVGNNPNECNEETDCALDAESDLFAVELFRMSESDEDDRQRDLNLLTLVNDDGALHRMRMCQFVVFRRVAINSINGSYVQSSDPTPRSYLLSGPDQAINVIVNGAFIRHHAGPLSEMIKIHGITDTTRAIRVVTSAHIDLQGIFIQRDNEHHLQCTIAASRTATLDDAWQFNERSEIFLTDNGNVAKLLYAIMWDFGSMNVSVREAALLLPVTLVLDSSRDHVSES